jgi:hypothetical protein
MSVGSHTVSAYYSGDANFNASNGSLTQQVSFRWDGFLQPINDTAHQTGLLESKFKLGQTIPVKFVLKNEAGQIVQQTPNPTFTRSASLGSCDNSLDPEDPLTIPADPGSSYVWDGNQYHYNWSTKGLTAGEYRIYANLADGTKQYVDICLTR